MKKKFRVDDWEKSEIAYLKYNAGKYSIEFISNKLNRSVNAIWQRLKVLNLKIKELLIGHDFLTEKDFAKEVNISVTKIKTFRKYKFIRYKKIGKYIGIYYDEIERIKQFLDEYIEPRNCCKILNIPRGTFTGRLIKDDYFKSLHRIKIGNTFYYRKIDIYKLKEIFDNSLSVKEFAKLTFYDVSTIDNFIANKLIESFYICGRRIYKSEIKKIKNL